MILTCPRCATRFLVEAEDIPPEGRVVRCGECGEEWRVEPSAGEVEEAPTPSIAAAPPAPLPEAPGPEGPMIEPALTPSPSPPAEALSMVAPIATDRARPRGRRAPGGLGLAPILAIALVVLVLALAVLLRGQIVRAWPATAPLYHSLGLPAPAPAGPTARHG